ncbi:MAG: PHB depolymerase family esterase [Candidatus Saccharimonadales bacterium]
MNKLIDSVAVMIVIFILLITAGITYYQKTHKLKVSSSLLQTIKIDNIDRTYTIYTPAKITYPAPMVVMLHGGYGSGAQAKQTYGWDQQADKYNFIVVYPDGFEKSWNTGGNCCGQAAKQNIDDVKFISTMLQKITSEIDIDKSRIYATGISNGGMLSYTLACNTDTFAAIGPVSATLLDNCNSPKPLSVIAIHGTLDKMIPYDGSEGSGTQKIDGPPILNLNATWRSINTCKSPSINTEGDVITSIANCIDNRSVELITINGAGHQWPGSMPNKLAQRLLHTDSPSTAINATDTIWHFFAARYKQ